jgi:hypothetical protein
MGLSKDKGDVHEKWLHELFGGKISKGSGNQWTNQCDVRMDQSLEYGFGIDGKSTSGKSLSITLELWDKVTHQSSPLFPMIALRFYKTDRLRNDEAIDLVTIEAELFAEILERANANKD